MKIKRLHLNKFHFVQMIITHFFSSEMIKIVAYSFFLCKQHVNKVDVEFFSFSVIAVGRFYEINNNMKILKISSWLKFRHCHIVCWALVVTFICIFLRRSGQILNNEDEAIDRVEHITFKLEHCNCKRWHYHFLMFKVNIL